MTDFIVTVPDSNYVKEYKTEYMYQGYIDTLTKLPDGKGRIKYLNYHNNIDTYDGDFNQGKISGYGTIVYKNSEIYKGQVLCSNRHGFGLMYSSNGKFLYDGSWNNDNINKPIYYKIITNNIMIFQGFKINEINDGWCVEHNKENGSIMNVSFYQDGIPIKGFEFIKHLHEEFEYKISRVDNIVKIDVGKFIRNLVEKLSKQDNLIEFLLISNNIEMLEEISYFYQNNTKNIKENTSFIIRSDKSVIEENIFLKENHIKILCSENEVIVGKYDKDKNIFIHGYKYFKEKNSMLYLNISEIESNVEYSINNLKISESGRFIKILNDWKLDGKGIRNTLTGSTYTGNFSNGLIKDGTETKNNVQVYNGTFISEKYNIGTLYHVDGSIKYQGEFENNKEHGHGSSFYKSDEKSDIIEYIGEWKNGYKHGTGTLFAFGSESVEIFTGQFIDDQIA
jgi:hypothetical protein